VHGQERVRSGYLDGVVLDRQYGQQRLDVQRSHVESLLLTTGERR
jgi:hypothetical protein